MRPGRTGRGRARGCFGCRVRADRIAPDLSGSEPSRLDPFSSSVEEGGRSVRRGSLLDLGRRTRSGGEGRAEGMYILTASAPVTILS